jgi:hypothetical protein
MSCTQLGLLLAHAYFPKISSKAIVGFAAVASGAACVPTTLHAPSCVQADVPFPMPRTMYGPRMTWIGANFARWTGVNAT